MIQIASEKVVSLGRAARHFPRRRRGKRPHTATLYRWARSGVRADNGDAVVLETIRVGRTLCTSVEAIQRFCERVSSTETPFASRHCPVTRPQINNGIEDEARKRGL